MVEDDQSATRSPPDVLNQTRGQDRDPRQAENPGIDSIPGDRYEPISELGTGGMAEVWLARDKSLQREVAIKLMKAQFLDDPDLVERFRREGVAAASINHPNTVRIYDVGTDNGIGYLVMEAVPGGTLTQKVRSGGPLEVEPWIRLGREVLGALVAVHDAGILHRDIKPANILFDDRGAAKVADFGIAHLDDARGLTGSMVVGTPTYLSPEVLQGELATAASDLFALGRTLIFAATGNAKNPGLTGNFPPELHQWIDQLLAFDYRARFPSAATALEHLEAISRGEATPAPTMSQQTQPISIGPYMTGNVPTLTDARPQQSAGLPWAVAGIAIGALIAVLALLLPGLRNLSGMGGDTAQPTAPATVTDTAPATTPGNSSASTPGEDGTPDAATKAEESAPAPTKTVQESAKPAQPAPAPAASPSPAPAPPQPKKVVVRDPAPVLSAPPAAATIAASLSVNHRVSKRALVGAPFKLSATTSAPAKSVRVMLKLGSRSWKSHNMSSADGTRWSFSIDVDGKWLSGAAYYIVATSADGASGGSGSSTAPHTLKIR